MSTLQSLNDLFCHQLKDLYSAEKQLADVLPYMKGNASNADLHRALADHLKKTKEHKNRPTEIADLLGIELFGETCNAMKGFIKEAKDFISEDAAADVRDAGIIADAQRIKHYEISAYGTTVQFAMGLNKEAIAEKLQKTLDEESLADQKLNELAVNNINQQAQR